MLIARGVVGSVLLMLAGSSAFSQMQESITPSSQSEALKTYLRGYLSLGGKVHPDTTTRITTARVKISGGNVEDLVYVSGQRWCGSGGCMLLILEPSDSTFKVLGKVTIVQLPIRLLSSTKYGHPDIGVTVAGGGILEGYEAVLSFNGKNYPRNPSLPPSLKVTAAQGEVIIGSIEGSVPLYD